MLTQDPSEELLIARAVGGDRHALECLLLRHHDRLARWLARRFPDDLGGRVAPEDVLQETFVEAFRRITHFQPRGREAFFGWLRIMAWHRLLDALKAHRAAKRGGGRRAVSGAAPAAASDASQSVVALLDVVAVDSHTPSRSAAGHEAVSALQVAMAGLKEEYREALRLRYLDGLAVADAAARMNRTERAVQMLCNRALKRLRQVMGGLGSSSVLPGVSARGGWRSR